MSQPIPDRLRAALADRYELREELGEGGMATVYLADDLKHERKVAVKVLRPELAAVIGGERFIAEIKTTAALQHPHILPLFDSGEADSYLYYVMPFVEGESLRERLDREGQLEVTEAVRIAKAIASALQYAHERDVIHRDIKPANILLHAGEPVVADFGIALAISAAGGGRMTETGLSLGTPHYMSPEQAAADRDLTARSDVYSLTCVLYEMLAGQPPHTGPSAQSVLVRILTESARPVSDLRPAVPRQVRAVVAKGLEKLPADRFRSAEELKLALDDPGFSYERMEAAPRDTAATTAAIAQPAVQPARSGSMGRGLHAAATAALVLVAGWLALTRGPGEAAPVPNVTIVLEDSLPGAFEPRVAADGTLAYGTGGGQVVVKRPGDLAFSVLPGPLSAFGFDLSPDGNWLAYGGPDGLYKVQLDGAANTRLWGGAGFASMPAWGDDGFIYFLTGTGEPEDLTRVPQAGGEPELLLQLPGLSLDPQPLPGGRGVAVMVSNASGLEARIVVVDVETGDTVSIAPAGYSPRWSPTGHILYAQATGSIWAVPFDPEKLEVTGAAAPVLDGVLTAALRSAFDVSTSGALVYLSGGGNAALGAFQFALATRDGRFEELPIEPSDHQDARISPDGTKLAYTKRGDIWVFDLDRGTNVALSEGGTGPHNPAWSPDGLHIAYDNGTTIMRRPVDRSVEPSEVGGTDLEDYPQEWLDDGTLIFSTTGNGDLYRIPAEGGAPEPLLTADWEERVPSISPDGRWIAYSSARSGRAAVYVRSWPELLNETPVSTSDQALDFLSQVGWAPDGSAIYYQVGGRIHVARVRTERGFEVVSDEPLDFAFPGLLMDIHPDGRFVVALTGEVDSADSTPPQLVLGTNWAPQVRRAFIGN